jgi:hypothetical protein
MRAVLRRTILVVCGFACFIAALIWSAVAASRLATLLMLVQPASPGHNVTPSTFSTFYQLSFLGLCLMLSASLVLLLWNGRPSTVKKIAVYFGLLLVLIPISAVNFHYGDYLMRASVQALLDLLLVALGITTVIWLRNYLVGEGLLRTFKYIVMFVLILEAVALPGLYSVLWLLRWQGIPVRGMEDKIVSGTATVVSATLAILGYLKDKKSDVRQNESRPGI